jgi:predicted transcriptional regulator
LRPTSQRVSRAADLVERDYKTVHRQLSDLAELGVIEFEDAKPGTPKKTQFPYDGLEIDLDLVDDDQRDPAPA